MNMHSNKLVVAIKNKGRVLREFKDQIRIPFGSEYSIYIKNLNSVRALVKIEIDGKDIGGGQRFVVQPNSECEIERSLANGNMNEGNRFKFIERTAGVEQARGIGAEDGLIRVEFQFEKVYPQYKPPVVEEHHHHHHHHDYWPYIKPRPYWDYPDVRYRGSSQTFGSASNVGGTLSSNSISGDTPIGGSASASAAPFSASDVSANLNAPRSRSKGVMRGIPISAPTQVNENGITVAGSVCDQRFTHVSSFATETETHVIVLRLIGEIEGVQVAEAVTVKAKQKCSTCNHLNKATAKFCSECGTSLIIV